MANRILGYKLLLCFSLMLVNLAKASEDTAQVMGSLPIIESKFVGVVLSPPLPPAKPTIYEDLFRYQLVTGSNVLPFSFMGKMAFGGYITPAATESIESHLKTQNRAGYMQSVGLVFYPLNRRFNSEQYKAAGKKAEIVSIGIRNIQMAGLTFSGDAFRLVFRGNGYYKGKTLDVGSNNFFALGMNTVDFGISVPKSKRIEKLYFSIAQVTQYNLLKTQNMSLYTSAIADSVVINGRFYSQSTAGLGFGQKGLGVMITMDRTMRLSSSGSGRLAKPIYYGVRDLGLLFLPTLSVDSRGYSWDENTGGLKPAGESPIKSVTVTQAVVSARDLQLGNWFTTQRDTLNSRLRVNSQKRSGTVISPFTLYAQKELFSIRPKEQTDTKKGLGTAIYHAMDLNFTYLNIPGYVLSTTLSWGSYYRPKGEQKWTSFYSEYYLGLGGFDTWNLGYKGFLKSNIIGMGQTSFMLDLRGLEAWLFPKRQHGAGISFGVRCKL
jgi:hypothetical protein